MRRRGRETQNTAACPRPEFISFDLQSELRPRAGRSSSPSCSEIDLNSSQTALLAGQSSPPTRRPPTTNERARVNLNRLDSIDNCAVCHRGLDSGAVLGGGHKGWQVSDLLEEPVFHWREVRLCITRSACSVGRGPLCAG
jgi:hypothetical protein